MNLVQLDATAILLFSKLPQPILFIFSCFINLVNLLELRVHLLRQLLQLGRNLLLLGRRDLLSASGDQLLSLTLILINIILVLVFLILCWLNLTHLRKKLVKLQKMDLIFDELVVFEGLQSDLIERHLQSFVDELLKVLQLVLVRRREIHLQILIHPIVLHLRRRLLRPLRISVINEESLLLLLASFKESGTVDRFLKYLIWWLVLVANRDVAVLLLRGLQWLLYHAIELE